MSELSRDALAFLNSLSLQSVEPVPHPAGGEFVVVPAGCSVEHLKPVDPPLTHVKARPVLADAASFCGYVERFRTPETVLFADRDRREVRAVFDYHAPPENVEAEDETREVKGEPVPAYCDHVASFPAPLTEEWARWDAIHRKGVPQLEFMEFLEENAADIVEPEAAKVLEIVADFRAHKSLTFESQQRLRDGNVRLTFHEDTNTNGREQIDLPPEIAVAIPVFMGAGRARLRVFLRFRIREGALFFVCVIHRRDLVLAELFDGLVGEIGAMTGIVPLIGRSG